MSKREAARPNPNPNPSPNPNPNQNPNPNPNPNPSPSPSQAAAAPAVSHLRSQPRLAERQSLRTFGLQQRTGALGGSDWSPHALSEP